MRWPPDCSSDLCSSDLDFSDKNIEFIEFIFRPHPDYEDIGTDAELIIDLGQISEDVIPNGRLNSEDGLPISASKIGRASCRGRVKRCGCGVAMCSRA